MCTHLLKIVGVCTYGSCPSNSRRTIKRFLNVEDRRRERVTYDRYASASLVPLRYRWCRRSNPVSACSSIEQVLVVRYFIVLWVHSIVSEIVWVNCSEVIVKFYDTGDTL